ncbi:hypothetical protein [Paenibacillus ferrarius]|nr:hypothetical protein [Paenibacillus ferrarius]
MKKPAQSQEFMDKAVPASKSLHNNRDLLDKGDSNKKKLHNRTFTFTQKPLSSADVRI